MANERINLGMSAQDAIRAMCGGNPGALMACLELLSKSEKVDPDAFNCGLPFLLILDTLGIYEERIYILFCRVCKGNIGKMIAVLRAYQFGELAGVDMNTLNYAIDNDGADFDLDAVVEAVKVRLPNFNPEAFTA